MNIITIILFLIYTWGFGFSVTVFIKNSENFFERNLMRIGIGLGVFTFLITFLNLLRVPLDWKIFFVLSLISPLFFLFKEIKKGFKPKFNLRLTKSNLAIIIMLIIFSTTLFIHTKGAFTYPWLEDGDPWVHAGGAKYVSIEKTVFEPHPTEEIFHYLDAYPPGYDGMIGILHQTSPSMNWTIKFFNALFISLTIIFFYFFTKNFMGNTNKALFATFILSIVPCYMSHFIWAISLCIPIFFTLMYCLEKTKDDKKWFYPSIFVLAGLLLIQPSMGAKLSFMLAIYWFVKWLVTKKFFNPSFWVMVFGLLLSMIWWVERIIFYGGVKKLFKVGLHQGGSAEYFKNVFEWRNVGGPDRLYNFNDFFIAQKANLITNPVGVGMVLMILLLIAVLAILFFLYTHLRKYDFKENKFKLYISYGLLVLAIISFFVSFFSFLVGIPLFIISIVSLGIILIREKVINEKYNSWKIISLLWLLFTFLGIHGVRLPVQLIAFRFWMLFAIAVSLVVVEGIWFLFFLGKQFKIPKFIILILIIALIIPTSAVQKYAVNTAMWGPGGIWLSNEEVQGYLWLQQLPVNTKIFTLTPSRGERPIGLDANMCYWCLDEINFRDGIINKSSSDINSFLKVRAYEYVILDAHFIKENGINETNEKLSEMISSGLFNVVHRTQDTFIFKIV